MDVQVSVIVPIYNVEKYLDRCIKSILNQTYQNFELLLINDGTKDSSLEICRQYRADRRIRIISQKNQGLSAARNTGIRCAKGRYLYFVDGDDYVASDILENLYNEMITEDADLVQCGFTWIMENYESKEEKYKGCLSKQVLTEKDWFTSYERNNLLFIVAWNKLYKKSLFDKIKYPRGKMTEDEYVAFPLFFTAQKIVNLNKAMYYYVKRETSLTSTATLGQRIDNYFDYSKTRLILMWNRNKTFFGSYVFLFYRDLLYYTELVEQDHLDDRLVIKMRKQSRRLLGCLFYYSDIGLKMKMAILKWNMIGFI